MFETITLPEALGVAAEWAMHATHYGSSKGITVHVLELTGRETGETIGYGVAFPECYSRSPRRTRLLSIRS